MIKTRILYALIFSLIYAQDVLASPGGMIFKTVQRSFWAKVVIIIIFLILLPFIIYLNYSENRKIKKTQNDLRRIAKSNPNFDWMMLKTRFKNVFLRVHQAWKKEDMKLASEFMTNWYWQNQQMVYLDQWEEDGLLNICSVSDINSITPVHLEFANDGEGSRIVVQVNAIVEDYLVKRSTNEIVEGEKGFNTIDVLWTFILKDNKWLLENIEESSSIFEYTKLKNIIPEKSELSNKAFR